MRLASPLASIARRTLATALVAAGALALCGASTGHAAGPAAALEIPFEKYTLANGLEVILHRDPSAPLVAVDLWYHVGSGDEMPGRSGFAHLFEHMMFQGTARTGEDRHFAILQEIGATDENGSTNPNRTNYYEVVPSNQLEIALWLESERMGYLLPAITAKSLANQRDVVRNERRQSYDNVAYGKDRFAIAAALYPEGHPYRHLTIGLHEDVEGGSLDDVRNFFRTWYVPANATLTLAGDFETAAAKRLVEKWFGSFPASARPEHRAVATPAIATPRRVEVHDALAKLRRVHFAWTSPSLFTPGDAELDLLASVLGREGSGRLYRKLVLERPLAQTVAVYQASLQRSSEYHIVVDLLPEADVAEVERIVDAELASVRMTEIGAAELHRAVLAYEDGFVRGLEPILQRAETLQSYNHFLSEPGRVQWDLDRYRNATPAAVLAVAKQHLDPQHRVEVMTLPVAAPQADPPVDFATALPAPTDAAAPQGLAFPDDAFRARQPGAGAVPALKMPPVERFTLTNGLEVVLLERHQVPTIDLDLEFPNGPVNDPPGKEGMSELCMDVLDDGTRRLSKVAFEEALADLGSAVRATAFVDRQGLSMASLSRNFLPTLDLWAENLLTPGLRAEDLARDAAQRLAGMQQERSAPSTLGRRLLGSVFYGPTHPIGRIETDASIGRVTLDDCTTLARTWLRPRGARLYVVGDTTRAALEPALAARLGAAFSGEPAVKAKLPAASPRPGRLFFSDVPGAAQSVIYIAEPGPLRQAADYPQTLLAMDVLGGSFSSRVNMNLREDKGYAYGAGAFVRYFPTVSVLRAAASVRTDATKESVRELYGEMKRLAGGGITAAELSRNIDGEVLALPARFATGGDALAAVRELLDYELPLDYWSRFGPALRAVTVARADAAAKAHVHPQQLQVLVVGDAAKVLPGLEELLATGVLPAGELVRLDGDGNVVAAKP